MIDQLLDVLKKLSRKDLDMGIKFENCEITIDNKKIRLDGELDMEVTEE